MNRFIMKKSNKDGMALSVEEKQQLRDYIYSYINNNPFMSEDRGSLESNAFNLNRAIRNVIGRMLK